MANRRRAEVRARPWPVAAATGCVEGGGSDGCGGVNAGEVHLRTGGQDWAASDKVRLCFHAVHPVHQADHQAIP